MRVKKQNSSTISIREFVSKQQMETTSQSSAREGYHEEGLEDIGGRLSQSYS